MKYIQALSLFLVAAVVAGCGSQPAPDDNKPAPQVQYKMIPSQKTSGN